MGVLFYELMRGYRPFDDTTFELTVYNILNEPPKPLPLYVPKDLTDLLKALLKKDPQARPTISKIITNSVFKESKTL